MGEANLIANSETLGAKEVIRAVLAQRGQQHTCLTCSFQAEDMIVLHLVRKWVPAIPILFLDTGYHFPETYRYRDQMTREWALHLVNVLPQRTVEHQESQLGILYSTNPTECCQLRKVEPLMAALDPFEIWFTGLRREQSPTRRNLKKIEQHCLPNGKTLLKVSPLADWTWAEVWEYTGAHEIRYLPQYDQGYASIGCQPCTAVPHEGSNPRSGRWGGRKLECGIHTFSEKAE